VPRLVRAWLLIAVIDGLFSGVLAQFAYGSSAARLFQGVASTAFGPDAFTGTALTIAGVLTHFTVALTWSTIFLLAYDNWPLLPRIAASRFGIAKIAAVYGPIVWMVMSFIVIPARTGRPPAITYRWWVQFFGHMIFVGWPIVAMIARPRQPFVPADYPASS
jgi:uncharacterized membrane protein YagU involved in acid resistance